MKVKEKRVRARVLLSLLCCLFMISCTPSVAAEKTPESTPKQTAAKEKTQKKSKTTKKTEETKRDNTPKVLEPSADGTVVYGTDEVVIDASNMSEGYIMIKYMGDSDDIRMQIETPLGETYTYRIPLDGSYDVFPLSDGSGTYQLTILRKVVQGKFAKLVSQKVEAQIEDENKVFLYPNQYVNFDASSDAVEKGKELAADAASDLDVVKSVYHFVTQNITYDYDKAETVQSGYLPVVDETLETKKGICFDYSSLMASMLRSQRIPTRLEIGYAGTIYHAWISVYIENEGWIDDMIVFDGQEWVLMDPTLASYAKEKTIREHMEEADEYYDMKYKY